MVSGMKRGEWGGSFVCVERRRRLNNTAIKLFDDIPDDTVVTVIDCHILKTKDE